MPRTQIPNIKAVALSPTGPASSTSMNPQLFPADVLNGNYFTASGRDLVTVYNSDTTPHTLSVFSSPDDVGRKADIVNYAVPGGGHVEFLLLATSLYTQTDAQVQLNADNALVLFYIRSL